MTDSLEGAGRNRSLNYTGHGLAVEEQLCFSDILDVRRIGSDCGIPYMEIAFTRW